MQGTPKAIEIKGIVRNATVIGAQDGQAEDLINLRFMDGSWRASGDGRLVHTMTGNKYTNLYVHTNVYRHLIGVRDGKLYWFANIADDGVTFEEIEEQMLCEDVGTDIIMTATGHMLIALNEGSRIALLFSRKSGKYSLEEHIKSSPDEESKSPYGNVCFRVVNNRKSCTYTDANGRSKTKDCIEMLTTTCGEQTPYKGDVEEETSYEYWKIYSGFMKIIAALKKKNSFHGPFLCCLALKMYDGKYVLASAPTYVDPSFFGDGHYSNTPSDYQFGFYHRSSGEQRTHYKSLYGNYGFGFGLPALIETNLTDTTYVRQSYYAGDRALYNPYMNSDNIADILGQDVVTLYGEKDGDISYGFANIMHAPTIGSFTMFMNEEATPGLPKASQDNVVYGKVNHLEFKIDKLNISDKLYKSLCVFVTPVFDLYDFTRIYKKSAYGEEIRSGSRSVRCFYADSGFPHPKIDATNYGTSYSGQSYGGTGVESRYNWGIEFTPERKFGNGNYSGLINQIKTSQFYCIKEIDIDTALAHVGEWVNVEIDERIIEDLYLGNVLPMLTVESFQAALKVYNSKYGFSYNGRLHLANYVQKVGFDWGVEGFLERDYSDWGKLYLLNSLKYLLYPQITNVKWQIFAPVNKYVGQHHGTQSEIILGELDDIYNKFSSTYAALAFMATTEEGQRIKEEVPLWKDWGEGYDHDEYFVPAEITFHSGSTGDRLVGYVNLFPSDNIVDSSRKICVYGSGEVEGKAEMIAYGITAIITPQYIDDTGTAIKLDDLYSFESDRDEPNGLIVSAVDNPLYFPVENYYRVGSGKIIALASNTIAVGTGQTGEAPLYVFCSDGIYAMFVDASGNMAYTNARVIARDILNNPDSVTPIDAGVVFTTDRGLMMIAGEQVEEIGAPAEGDVTQFWDNESVDYSKIATASMQLIAELPSELCSTTDFLTYLQDKGTLGKAAIVNYNHNMRELIISNPNYPYSYVLDREGNWSRRDYTAAEYVNNYPTSYRVTSDGKFYKVDDEGDANTSLEHRKEADNQIFYLSNVIKLDSIGFKQAYRFVVRGYFETKEVKKTYTDWENLGTITIDPSVMYDNNRKTLFNIPSLYDAIKEGDIVRIVRRRDGRSQDVEVITKGGQPPRLTFSENLNAYDSYGEYIISKRSLIAPSVGIVVEGSYDGIKFNPLGYNRRSGKFTDIGCNVSHTDMRFYRVVLAGQVTGKTRIDYMELSAVSSKLNTKIR